MSSATLIARSISTSSSPTKCLLPESTRPSSCSMPARAFVPFCITELSEDMNYQLEELAANRSFGGWHKRFKHRSEVLDCDMIFGAYLPPAAETTPVPALWWLSGLTCTDQNFMEKAGAQRMAAELGVAIIAPDTSPRGVDLPGEDDSYDFGSGAGFYLNATRAPWDRHYHMFDYVTDELYRLVSSELPVSDRQAISGHSMGGHGALICAL